MSQEELLKALEEDARRERNSLLRDAEAEAGTIRSEALEELKRLKEEDLLKFKVSLSAEIAKATNDARAYSNGIISAARNAAIAMVREKVEDEFKRLPQRDDYPEILGKLFMEALDSIGEVKTIVFVPESDLSIFRKMDTLKDRDVRPVNMDSGVMVTSEDGRVKITNTTITRLTKAMPELNVEIRRVLWNSNT